MSLDLTKLSNLRRNGGGWTAACPVCRSNGSDKSGNHLGILPDGKFNCVADSSSTHRSAIFAMVGHGKISENVIPTNEQVTIDRTWPLITLDRLIKDYSYWENRGVSTEVIEKLSGGVAISGQMAHRWVIPIFDENKKICGFTGRALKPSMIPRWKHIGSVKKWVWGGLDAIQETEQAVLVEGAGCRLALDSHDIPQSLVLWGVNLSEAILAKLIELNPHDIVIATNNEASGIGNEAARRIKKTLDKFFDEGVVRIGLPPKKDFLECSAAEFEEWRKTVLERQELGLDKSGNPEIIALRES